MTQQANKPIFLVIMAGGIGSRFWPLSTSECPKQFIDIMNEGRTMIQATAQRFSSIVQQENIIIVTSQKYEELVKTQLPFLLPDQILMEPCMRNTAPCIAWATWKIIQKEPDAIIIVAPSDHLITNETGFCEVINESVLFLSEHEALLTLGMKANRPETGYGYIQAQMGENTGAHPHFHKVKRFAEKPNLETALEYLKSGDYYWNSGIFLWKAKTIATAIRKHLPSLAQFFDNAAPNLNTPNENEFMNRHFSECESISVDYGIMEKAENIYVRTAAFGWSDLGTWGSLHELSEKDTHNNVQSGQIKLFETSNSIIKTQSNKKVVIQGLDGYIVVETAGALLICKKDQEQRIKAFQ